MMGTINTAKAAYNWKSARQREDACHSCIHATRSDTRNVVTWWCGILHFYTSPMAICDQLAIQPEEVRHG